MFAFLVHWAFKHFLNLMHCADDSKSDGTHRLNVQTLLGSTAYFTERGHVVHHTLLARDEE